MTVKTCLKAHCSVFFLVGVVIFLQIVCGRFQVADDHTWERHVAWGLALPPMVWAILCFLPLFYAYWKSEYDSTINIDWLSFLAALFFPLLVLTTMLAPVQMTNNEWLETSLGWLIPLQILTYFMVFRTNKEIIQ